MRRENVFAGDEEYRKSVGDPHPPLVLLIPDDMRIRSCPSSLLVL
jgi:hypothetical protein